MDIISKNFNRDLTENEMSLISGAFPKANVNEIRFIGNKGEQFETQESNPSLCQYYSCVGNQTLTQVYNATSGKSLGRIQETFKKAVCTNPEFKCVEVNVFYATYNCIGWALGITKWLNPSEITLYIKEEQLSHQQAIDKFLDNKKKLYPSDHISNIDNIVDKLHAVSGEVMSPSNNTVVFYFKNDDCQHGSRYLTTVQTQKLDKWTSKLGQEILISHKLEDLTGEVYGNMLHYADMSNHYTNLHEEL